jgi:hypothetical protein
VPRFDATTAEVLVFTFKEGLLSPVAHDLKLKAADFSVDVEVEKGEVRARFRADAIRVVCAMKDGRENPGGAGEREKAEIERNMRNDVLEVKKHPDIVFEGRLTSPDTLEGKLTLHGTTRALTIPVRDEGGKKVVEVTLDQRLWGITPFKAMMGTLKIKPEVRIVARVG